VLEQVIVSSFVPRALHELRAADAQVRRAYLMGTDTRRPDVRARELWPFFALRAVEAAAWHPYYDLPMLDQVLPLVRKAGYQVSVWTVDDPDRMRALAALGATGIITNRPDVGREVLRGRP
jgi:glycerophosphoryl diester phosphodiesterase